MTKKYTLQIAAIDDFRHFKTKSAVFTLLKFANNLVVYDKKSLDLAQETALALHFSTGQDFGLARF